MKKKQQVQFKPKKSVALSGALLETLHYVPLAKLYDLHYRGYDILDFAEKLNSKKLHIY